ncbi:hypothetical protein DMC25_26590 [Caulobacter sp. D4A]|nr:hypothetical protein DMC25_26590 [Caulobacter sp. D4A]PXA93359.1 hypothetical protein DMC18_09035 [Caulobacter sp. D5]
MAQTPAPEAAPAPAAKAKPTKSSGREGCFFADNIRGYQVVDDKTLNVEISRKEVYELKLFYSSFDLDTALRIGIKSRGSSWICSPLDAEVIVPETIRHSYPIQSIRRLTPEEVEKAYPPLKKKQPKS